MLIYWELRRGGVQETNSDREKNDKGCQKQKPQMKNDEDKNRSQI